MQTEFSAPPGTAPVGAGAPLMDVLATMRAMRRIKPDPVPDELLERVIEAATWAPSASNAQAYEFVLVTDRDQMHRLAELWRRCVEIYLALFGPALERATDSFEDLTETISYQRDHFEETPALVIACYRLPRPDAATLRRIAGLGARTASSLVGRLPRIGMLAESASVYPGVQNLLLAARVHGLAANITILRVFLESEWKRALGIPRDVHTFAAIPLGWPLGQFGPVRRRPARDAIHRDRW